MAMAEAPGMMGGAFGPQSVGPGQGEDHSGYSASLAMGAVKDMARPQMIEAVSSDVGFQIREHELGWNIDSVDFSIKRQVVKEHRGGSEKMVDTMVFDKFGGKALQDVTSETTDDGRLWERTDERARKIAETEGESWHSWISPGAEDRLYVAHNKGDGTGELHSVRLYNSQEENRWSLLDALSGEKQDRNSDIKNVTVVRREDKPLDIKEVVTKYTQSLSPFEIQRLSPYLNNLWQEAAVPNDIRRQRREEQEKWLSVQVEEILLKEKSTQEALGVVAQGVVTWAKNFEQPVSIRQIPQVNIGRTIESVDRNSQFGFRPFGKDIPKRHKGGSRGYGFRWFRFWEQEKLTKVKMVPRMGKLDAKEVGETFWEEKKSKEMSKTDIKKTLFSPFFMAKSEHKVVPTLPKMADEERNAEAVDIAKSDIRKRNDQMTIRGEMISRDKNVSVMDKSKVGSGEGYKSIRTSKSENKLWAVSRDGKKIKVNKEVKEGFVKVGNLKDIFTGPKHKEKEVLPKIKKETKLVSVKETEKRKILMITRKRGLNKEYSSTLYLETKKGKVKERKIKVKRSEKKLLAREIKKLKRMERLLKRMESMEVSKRRKERIKLVKRKEILIFAKRIWGKESKNFKLLKEEKISRKLIRRLRREILLRKKKIEGKELKRELGKRRREKLRLRNRSKDKRIGVNNEKIKLRRRKVIFELKTRGRKLKEKRGRRKRMKLLLADKRGLKEIRKKREKQKEVSKFYKNKFETVKHANYSFEYLNLNRGNKGKTVLLDRNRNKNNFSKYGIIYQFLIASEDIKAYNTR